MFKKISKIFSILVVAGVMSAYQFPDKLPDWQNIPSYKLDNLQFGSTTVNDFLELNKSMQRNEQDQYVIFSENNPLPMYKSMRVGFRNNVLDFLEFELQEGINIKEIIGLYGRPDYINKNYSEIFDYYDYDFFNIVTDKEHQFANTITIFRIPEFNSEIKEIVNYMPDYKSFNFINKFIPGEFLESDFLANFSGVVPVKKTKFDTESTFTINEKQLKSHKYYKEITFRFQNGVLNFIGLSPKHLNIKKVQQNYGKLYTKQPAGEGKSFYEYKNFMLIVDDKTGKVLNVGIVSAM